MEAVTVGEVRQSLSELLAQVEAGAEILITRDGRPVAILAPYSGPAPTSERDAAVERAIALTRQGLAWCPGAGTTSREEMHER